jgi:thymidylate synthase
MNNFNTTSEAYTAALSTLIDSPDFVCSPRGQTCSELVNWLFIVEHPTSDPIVTVSPDRNKKLTAYLAAETELFLSGELRASVWAAKASKFWAKLANSAGLISSNYGWLTMRNSSLPNGLTPWEWARMSLLRDSDSRQAYVRVSLPEHQWLENRDQVCTMHAMFMLREGRLYETTVMRSNDVVRGLAYDMPWWCRCLDMMVDDLNAAGLRCVKGTYSHLAHSLHLYHKDLSTALEMLGRK